MLQQMAEFDVRAAKCTVAADRQAVQQQVQELFRSEHPWSTREGPDSVDEGELCTEALGCSTKVSSKASTAPKA